MQEYANRDMQKEDKIRESFLHTILFFKKKKQKKIILMERECFALTNAYLLRRKNNDWE